MQDSTELSSREQMSHEGYYFLLVEQVEFAEYRKIIPVVGSLIRLTCMIFETKRRTGSLIAQSFLTTIFGGKPIIVKYDIFEHRNCL